MEFREFTAKTSTEAITNACLEFGTSSDNLEYEIVREGTSGFFGIGSKLAIVKVRKKDIPEVDIFAEVPKKEVKPEKKETVKKEVVKTETVKKETVKKETVKPEPVKTESAKKESVKKDNVKKDNVKKDVVKKENVKKEVPVKETVEKETVSKETVKESPKKDVKKSPKKENKPVAEAVKAEPVQEVKTEEKKEEKKVVIRTEDQIAAMVKDAEKFLYGVFKAMELPVELHISYDKESDCLDIDFEGDDMGILIGKRGQTLDSLQYLTSLVVNKEQQDYIRVKLDTENYRSRRKDTLENLAKNIAFKVRKTRKPVVLEPMNPYERRIIHSALQGNKYVETYSEGNEPYRHVVVVYKGR